MTVAYCIAAYLRPSQMPPAGPPAARRRPGVPGALALRPAALVLRLRPGRERSGARCAREAGLLGEQPAGGPVRRNVPQLAVGEGCSYVVMLSGQDYPLRHVGGLEAELSAYDVWADINPLFAGDGSCNWP